MHALFRRRQNAPSLPLLFRWRHPHWLSFRLVFLLIFSLFLHLAAFYAFEVVYPPSRKQVSREASLWLLPRGDPAARALLARHGDRLGVFDARAEQGSTIPPSPVAMSLSFDNHRPEFRRWPADLPSDGPAFPDVLPPILPPPASFAEAPNRASHNVRAAPLLALEWRSDTGTARSQVDGAAGASLAGLLQGGPATLHAGFDSGRVIRHLLVIEGPGGAAAARLRQALAGRRAPGTLPAPPPGGIAWAVVTLHPAAPATEPAP
jgi:hypothetical protein